MKRRLFSNRAWPQPGRSRGSCAKLFHSVFAAAVLAASIAPNAFAQIGSLDKGHELLINDGLQIWGLNTDDAYQLNYNNLAGAGMDAVIWSTNEASAGLLSAGQNWGKWIEPNPSAQYYTPPSSSLTATETQHYADLVAIQVGDEQQSDLESANGYTKAWFTAAHAGNNFSDKLLYVNSTYWNDVSAYFNFIGSANPDAISWDAYPFGSIIAPYNWLGKAQFFRRSALGSYIQASGNSARPYGLYLQTYHGGDGARDPSELEMRWQMFTAWTLGYTFVDAFTAGGGNTSLFNSGNENLPTQPRYDQFKESARQSHNLGPALTKLISTGYGPNVVLGQDPSGNPNQLPADWQTLAVANEPQNQPYLTSLSAVNLGTKNGGHPGDVYVGFFNPLLTTYGDPAGEAYFMITNALGAYLQDPTGLVTDYAQQITVHFNFGSSGITSLERLRRSDGQVEPVSLTHVSGSLYDLVFNLDGGTGDLFKYNDGTPFVGVELPLDLLYWDNDGNAAGNNTANGSGLGGSGTWDTSASKWFNGTTNGIWAANKTAIFIGTAGTVTLGAAQSANSIQFKSNGYTLTGSTLTVGAGGISVDSGMTATINSTVAGSLGLIKTGAGTLVLGNGTNSYTGGTTISAGTVRFSSDGNLGATSGNITINGGTLQFASNVDINNNRGITLGATGGTIDTQGFTNPSGYNAPAGGFTGPGDLTKIGSGTFFAAATSGGANTSWTGRLILKEGIWRIVASDGLPYNVPLADGLKADQVTFDGGSLQLGATINPPNGVTNGRRGMTVTSNGGTIDTQNFDLTWAGPLAGSDTSAVLNKIGDGMLRFTGANSASTYSGIVNINAGTLRLDNGNTMGSLATMNLVTGATLNVTDNQTVGSLAGSGGSVTLSPSTFTVGGNNKSTTFSGVISGSSAALTKTGTGIMTLSGANTYTGTTTVSAGTLRINNTTGNGAVYVTGGTLGGSGTIAGAITVSSGGHIAPGNSPGTLFTSNNVSLLTGSLLDYDLANVTTVGGGVNDLLSIVGNLSLGSSIALNINAFQGDLANGTYKLIKYTGGLTGNTTGWTIGSSTASGAHGYNFSSATPGEIQLIVSAVTPTWTGVVNAYWDNGGNWQTNVEPTSTADVVFPTPIPGTGATITLTSGELAKTLTFNDSYTLSGGDLNVAAGTVNVASGKTATISSAVTGSAGITASGAGTLVFGGTNTYTGGTSIDAGTLRVAADANLGNSGGAVTFGGGALNTTASFSTSRAVSVNSGGGSIDNSGTTITSLTGTISGTAVNTLTKSGSGTLVLAQSTPRSGLSSTWLGNVTVSGGTLKVGNGGSTGFLPGYDPIAYAGLPPTVPTVTLSSGATLEFNHAASGPTQDATHAVVITGAGNVVISGAKTEVFVANNDYTGSTTINGGSKLRIGWGGALNTGGLGATVIANSGTLTFSNDHNTIFPGSISGTGTLLKEFGGTLTLSGTAAHSGGTTITGGTLRVGGGGTTGSISGNITNNATLAFNRSDNLTYAGVISGTGGTAQAGSGTLILTGANSYSGGTNVASGTLLVNNSTGSGTGTGAVGVQSGAVLGGTGAILGGVTVNNGAHLAPGASIGSLNVGALTLAVGSILDFELDTVLGVDKSDLVNVTATNGLTINGGTLNLTNAGAMTTGTYTLIDYAGSLNGSFNSMTLGSTPDDFSYLLVNNTSNKSIDLVVTPGGDFDHNGGVNAADFVTWRKGVGTTYTASDYNTWREHFGETNASAGPSFAAVPEPAGWVLLVLGVAGLFGKRQRLLPAR